MNVLKTAVFEDYMAGGGSTKPWQMRLEDASGEQIAYVVKMFTQRHVDQTHAIGKEAIGSILAREFDLPVPEFGFADFTLEFIRHGLSEGLRKELNSKAKGLKFASRMASGRPLATAGLPTRFLKDYDMAKVYAFDVMIYNVDRTFDGKQNLLINDEDFLLIDHELCLPFINQGNFPFFRRVLDKLNNGEIIFPFQRHLFYPYLKGMRKSQRSNPFDEFIVYLNILDLAKIQEACRALGVLGIAVGEQKLLFEYLSALKRESHQFGKLLLGTIS
ncbi:HipA family kinase [Flaviaesturariibacter aridisoli]|uniref:HipA-like kinase domain-containing protein n=1 Tax=Flaviaesturariibacter aridisoli TaxID=2545761 RepID=A0A4R4E586_9BACT|nr:HipA family kinase [Flaviaesturariibacter aridisoli]TCZ72798.1 hypothetical protein E0486_08430 [Flaviaesturariibacter aridisoli]